ncbi:ABC transporter permease subunit [Metasolibacillus meyeri]|uniref:ABC transporter permease subunit n=1 Tax=Metasolibacillus meyeri TaxID=1071052 RepID=UPI000D30EED3|nr:ABC transporter permease subunit [Metasolibacillus meyeri]
MKEVVHFILKGIAKSKYTLLLPLAIILLITSLFIIHYNQSGATQQELEEIFKGRKITVDHLIGRAFSKERLVGLTEEQRQSLDSLLVQEQYLKEISSKLKANDLAITSAHVAYINEYDNYVNLVHIPYNNEKLLEIEQRKAAQLIKHDLPYTEQVTPYNTALFTKQLFQLLFSPVTAFLFLLIFCYKYLSDRENRLFDFFKVNSLSTTAVYYGYFIPFLLIALLYIVLASSLSILLPLITGNIHTIYYPIAVAVGSTIVMVPVWKWLVFLPIGWGIFVALLLILATCLLKQRSSLGMTLAIISVPFMIVYILSLRFGFYMANPLHLLVSYEANLLATNRYMSYLVGMFILLILCMVISYPLIKLQWGTFRTPALHMNKKQYHPYYKWKLLQFEHLKKKRKGHILFTFLLLFGIIGGTVAVVNQQFQAMPMKALKAIEGFQSFAVENRTHWKMLEEDFELEIEMQQQSGEEIESPEENPHIAMVEQLNYICNMLEILKGEIHAEDFPEKFRELLKSLEAPTYKDLDGSLWNVTIMASEEQRYILEEKGIKEWSLGNHWVSNFNELNKTFHNDEVVNLYQDRNMKYGNSGLFSIYKYLDWNIMQCVLAVFVLLLWATMADERQPNPSINFLTTKPIRVTSIYLTKWLYNLAIAYSLLLISAIFIFLVSVVIGGLGEAEYPILVYATHRLHDDYFYSIIDDASFYFENLSTLILKSSLLIFAQIFFLNSLFSLIGKWMKNHYVTIVLTIIVVVVGYFLASHYIAMDGMYINPFVYFDTWHVVDGWKSILARDSKVNVFNGTMILLISGSLLFCIGLLGKRKVVV